VSDSAPVRSRLATGAIALSRSTLAVALAGTLLLWAALPPLALGWLGWIAPVPWLLLVERSELAGRRPYTALWLAGFVFWLMAIHWLRLPHPATSLGWIALSAYLAFYLPVFVGLSRVAVHRLNVPLWLAAPVVWTGLELARAHVFTGFLMASLAHTQVHWTALIQVSDLVGEYGVDFVVMLAAACVSDFGLRVLTPRRCPGSRTPKLLPPVVVAVGSVAGVLTYGHLQLREAQPEYSTNAGNPQSAIRNLKSARVALIQGNSLAEWKQDPSRGRQIMDEYVGLSERAVQLATESGDGRPLDLVVWPETMFRTPLITFDEAYQLPAEISRTKEELSSYGKQDLANLASRLQTPVLVGIDRMHYSAAATPAAEPPPPRFYNSSVMVDRQGQIVGTYDKIHRVMFGEYIPFAEWLPFLYGLTPLTGGIQAGTEPAALELDGIAYSPNICYETAIPHVIRRQVASLQSRARAPHVLVNLTNDAWYWGSSELDMHLACGVFRAVETRRPLVVAANGGISAHIDHFGRVRTQSPRMQPDVIIADVQLAAMHSPYVRLGDWFAGTCLAACVVLAIVGWHGRRNRASA
jgi:apolipoprotein N-acyltransferase